ncbi:MAG: hypothetical protein AAB899_04040 [Patescibacteria group bacterium]
MSEKKPCPVLDFYCRQYINLTTQQLCDTCPNRQPPRIPEAVKCGECGKPMLMTPVCVDCGNIPIDGGRTRRIPKAVRNRIAQLKADIGTPFDGGEDRNRTLRYCLREVFNTLRDMGVSEAEIKEVER